MWPITVSFYCMIWMHSIKIKILFVFLFVNKKCANPGTQIHLWYLRWPLFKCKLVDKLLICNAIRFDHMFNVLCILIKKTKISINSTSNPIICYSEIFMYDVQKFPISISFIPFIRLLTLLCWLLLSV